MKLSLMISHFFNPMDSLLKRNGKFGFHHTCNESFITSLSQIELEINTILTKVEEASTRFNPRANGTKRRSGHKPGARVTNFVLGEFKVVARGS